MTYKVRADIYSVRVFRTLWCVLRVCEHRCCWCLMCTSPIVGFAKVCAIIRLKAQGHLYYSDKLPLRADSGNATEVQIMLSVCLL